MIVAVLKEMELDAKYEINSTDLYDLWFRRLLLFIAFQQAIMSIAITILIVFLGKVPSTSTLVCIPFAIAVELALPKLLFMAVFF
jgi:hypothetical protein